MKLDLDARLRAFAAYARQRSFSKAADDLFISQPAVSKHIADLERDLDVQLVNRRSAGGGLTEAGTYLAGYVLQAEALLSQAVRGLDAFKITAPVQLTVAASGTPGDYLLYPVFAAFQKNHPVVRIGMTIGTSAQVLDAVRRHEAELGVLGGLATAAEVEVEPLLEDNIILVGSPELAGRSFSPRDLRGFTWIHREEGSSTRVAVEGAWKDLGIIPKTRIELPSWETVKQAVVNNVGIAACSQLVVRTELQTGLIIKLEAPFWNLRRTISLIYPANIPLTPAAELFREELVQHFSSTTVSTSR